APIDVIEGDQVARKIYACAECCEKYRLLPLGKSGRPTSPKVLGPVKSDRRPGSACGVPDGSRRQE
ncbi:hypothetical protein ACWD4B_30900, partial [Streptomyces sp. NPDC002536]